MSLSFKKNRICEAKPVFCNGGISTLRRYNTIAPLRKTIKTPPAIASGFFSSILSRKGIKDRRGKNAKFGTYRKNVSLTFAPLRKTRKNPLVKRGGNPLFRLDEENEYEDDRVRLGYENFRELEEMEIRNNAGFDHPYLSRQIFEYAYKNPKQLFCDEMIAMYPRLRMLIEKLLKERVNDNEDNNFFSIDKLRGNHFIIQISNNRDNGINLPLSDLIVRRVSSRIFADLNNRRLNIKKNDDYRVIVNMTLDVLQPSDLSTAGSENIVGFIIGITKVLNRPLNGRRNKDYDLSITW
jgi:hypothetical protein